jgi:hypothetical protein
VSTLERSAGDHMVSGTSPHRGARLVDNGVWTLDLQASGAVVYEGNGKRKVLTTVDAPPGQSLDYTVVVDPNTREHYGVVEDTLFYLPTSTLDGPRLAVDGDPPGPLCSLLTDRLGRDG